VKGALALPFTFHFSLFTPFTFTPSDSRPVPGIAYARRSSQRTSYTPPGSSRIRVKTWLIDTSR